MTNDHEEVDSRMCLNVDNALNKGTPIVLRTVDTDVVITLIGVFHDLFPAPSRTTVIVGFGTGKNIRYYHINPMLLERKKLRF